MICCNSCINSLSISSDDDDAPDTEPAKDHLKIYRQKLRDLALLLNDAYAPADAYKLNEKLTKMGRIPLFVSICSFWTWTLHIW